jgi:ribosomal protein S18
MELKAIKTFSSGGASLTRIGTIFKANEKQAEEYIRLKLAEPTNAKDQEKTANLNIVGETAPQPEPAQTDYINEELQSKTITELRKIAKDNGVTGYTSMNKADLITAILTKQLEA